MGMGLGFGFGLGTKSRPSIATEDIELASSSLQAIVDKISEGSDIISEALEKVQQHLLEEDSPLFGGVEVIQDILDFVSQIPQ